MRSLFAVVLALLVASALAANSASLFRDFKHRFNRVYESVEEEQYRFEVFKANVEIARELDARADESHYGVTKFMDLTPAEFKQLFLMTKEIRHKEGVPTARVRARPVGAGTNFDWGSKGAVTPVYNQGQCGSCWAFSTTEAIESAWFLSGKKLAKLAMQQIVDCDTTDQGCDGGDPPTAYQYVISAGGLDSLSSYPYTAQDGTCAFKAKDVVAKISDWEYVTQDQDEGAMLNFVSSTGPPSICVDAESWQYYTGGIITPSDGCGTSLDHCVQLTGFGSANGTDYWHVRNSWGTDWGEKGYLRVQRGSDVCGIAQEVTWPKI
jgi:C1A family cysteine protease